MKPDLQDLLGRVWRSLEDATARRTPFTLGYLGTTDATQAPRVRAIILRGFDPDRGCLMFATHMASAKIEEIRLNPLVAVTVTDDDAALQLRMEGRAEIVGDPTERRVAWESLASHTRHLYRSPLAPGTPVSEHQTSESEREAGRRDENAEFARFAWVRIQLERLDWLDLSSPEHERCQFVREGPGWTGERVAP